MMQIRIGDKLKFSTKSLNDAYGHNEPVEIVETGYGPSPWPNNDYVTCRVWQPFLYAGQEPYQFNKVFHKSHFLHDGMLVYDDTQPSWFQRAFERMFG